MTILQDIYQLKPSNLITLYELDLSPCIGRYGATTTDVYRWCDGVNEVGNDIVFGGVTYTRYPVQATGFDKQGNGTIPRPKLVAGNYGGIIGNLARDYNDIVGAKLKRIRTFARYLDAINFKADNYYKKSNDFTNAVWSKSNTSVATTNTILPFQVGSKVSITGVLPSAYNITGTVLTSTTTTVTFSGTATGALVQAGTITGSGYSSTIGNVSGTGSIITITFNPITTSSPVGTEPIFGITESAVSNTHTLTQVQSYTAGKTYCSSIYARAGMRSRLRLNFSGNMYTNATARYAYFDLNTGTVSNVSTGTLTATIKPVPGNPNWYRCSISDTAEVSYSSVNTTILYLVSSGTTTTYLGDASQPALLLCAPQLTEGSIYPQEYYAESGTTINTNPYADSTQYLDKEVWTIDRKSNENSAFVEWELTAPYDLMGVRIPRRQCIQNVCPWKYRDSECGYTGTTYFNIKDETLSLTLISTTGTVSTIAGTGPWTAKITGMSNTTGLSVGSYITATNGTGKLYGGTPTSCVVTSIDSTSSISFKVTGGTIPVAGTVTNIYNTRRSEDICGKRVTSCKLRFPGGQALPYGGFPAVGI